MKRSMFAKASLLLFALLAGFLVLELLLRGLYSVHLSYDMEMWRYAVELKQSVEDPRSHIHIPSKHGNFMGVDLNINSKGNRDRETAYEKPAGTYRILAIGDSHTLGWGVPFEQIFSKLIENRLNAGGIAKRPYSRFEVVNMGMGNYNTEQELAAFTLEGIRYQPDAALLFISIHNIEPALKHASNMFTRNSYVYAFLCQRIAQLKPLILPGNHYVEYYHGRYKGESWARYQATLENFIRQARERHVRLVPVLLPEFRSLDHYPFKDSFHVQVTEVFSKSGVGVIDVLPAFEGKHSRDFLVARDDPHSNAEGNRIIADFVYNRLVKEGWIP